MIKRRREALARGVPVVRTLGLLVDAVSRGLEHPDVITRLEQLPSLYPGLKPFYAKPLHFENARRMAWEAWTNRERPGGEQQAG